MPPAQLQGSGAREFACLACPDANRFCREDVPTVPRDPLRGDICDMCSWRGHARFVNLAWGGGSRRPAPWRPQTMRIICHCRRRSSCMLERRRVRSRRAITGDAVLRLRWHFEAWLGAPRVQPRAKRLASAMQLTLQLIEPWSEPVGIEPGRRACPADPRRHAQLDRKPPAAGSGNSHAGPPAARRPGAADLSLGMAREARKGLDKSVATSRPAPEISGAEAAARVVAVGSDP